MGGGCRLPPGSIPGRGTKIPQAMWCSPKPKQATKKNKTKYDTQIKSHALGILAERFQKDLREVGRDLNILLLMDQPGT